MEIRHTTNPKDARHYTTERLREEFLIENLFREGEIHFTYSHHDRFIMGGAVPTNGKLYMEAGDALKTDYFLECREMGVINIGHPAESA